MRLHLRREHEPLRRSRSYHRGIEQRWSRLGLKHHLVSTHILYNKIKKLIILIIKTLSELPLKYISTTQRQGTAGKPPKDHLRRQIFKDFKEITGDKSGLGCISRPGFLQVAAERWALTPALARACFDAFDTDGSKEITLDEYLMFQASIVQ